MKIVFYNSALLSAVGYRDTLPGHTAAHSRTTEEALLYNAFFNFLEQNISSYGFSDTLPAHPGRTPGRLCGCETGGKNTPGCPAQVCGPGTRAGRPASVSRP